MGVYISSDGTTKDTATLNTFNLVNGLVKAVKEDAQTNIESLKAELLARLDTRPKEGEANPKLVIPFSESDCQDLEAGEEFDWTFETDKGQSIDIHIRLETQEDIEG